MKVAPEVGASPQWLEPTFQIKSGDDPLALGTVTIFRIIPRLVPGVLANTRRARYLSFFAWLLHRFASQRRTPTNKALSEFIKRHEHEFALAVLMCPRDCGASPLGSQQARPIVRRAPDAFGRGESVESFLGGYGLYYRTTLRELGLVAPVGTALGGEPTPVDLLRPDSVDAVALAELFNAAVGETAYVRQYANSTKPIPRSVLVDFATHACLCRLDDRVRERDVLRHALLEAGSERDPHEVETRREAFALFLQMLAETPTAGESDRAFRAAIWRAFVAGAMAKTRIRSTIARWAALVATHAFYASIHLLWTSAGPALRDEDRGDGLSRADLEAKLNALAEGGTLKLPTGRTFKFTSSRQTAELLAALTGPRRELPEFTAWAADRDGVLSALVLMLATYARLPDPTTVDAGWADIGNVNGEHQPGLLRMAQIIREHLGDQPTIGESLFWAIRTFLLWPHEEVAQSKLPDFTFRFRWEGGRLRFYSSPLLHFDEPALGDIRSSALATLSHDLGYCEPIASGYRVTPAGKAFVRDVFA